MNTDAPLDQEAADWLVRLEDDATDLEDARLQKSFFDWLRRSPQHVKAFLDSADALRALDGLDSQRRIDVRALMDERLADVITLPQQNAPTPALPRGAREGVRKRFALTAAVAIVAVCTVFFAIQRTPEYVTAIGEQRTFKLDDGSVLHLNTQSRAEVAFSKQTRQVRLIEGEALFVVERDAARPFLVESGGVTIRAVGTQFNVYRHANTTTVSVVEGAVQVAESRLGAGEEASVTNGRVKRRLKPDVADAIAWRARRLVFRDTPLAAVAAEFNRYNKTQIHIEGAAARDKQLTAIFSADHPQSLILYMRKDSALAVEQSGMNVTIRTR